MRRLSIKRMSLAIMVGVLVVSSGCVGDSGEPTTGELIVLSDPVMEAKIEIDGEDTGKVTNATFSDMEPGVYEIKLTKENPKREDLPFIGEAKIRVEAGKKKRVTVVLNVMSVQPRRQAQSKIIAETEGQKSVLDFYAAINASDYSTAYGLLGSKQKKGYRSSRNFTKIWRNVSTITISSLVIRKLPGSDDLIEEDVIEASILYKPLKGKPPLIPKFAVQADPKELPDQKWMIKTEGDPKDPTDVWKIIEISKPE